MGGMIRQPRPLWYDQVTEVDREEALALLAMGIDVFVTAYGPCESPMETGWCCDPFDVMAYDYWGFDYPTLELNDEGKRLWRDHFFYIPKESDDG